MSLLKNAESKVMLAYVSAKTLACSGSLTKNLPCHSNVKLHCCLLAHTGGPTNPTSALPWLTVLKCQPLRLLDLTELLDRRQHLIGYRLVDLHQANGILALGEAAQMEGRDIDPGIAEQHAERADEAGLVHIGYIEHMRAEFRFELDALDLDDARLAVGEYRSRHRAFHFPGPDGESDISLIGAALGLAHFIDLDAAVPRHHRCRNHVDIAQHRLEHACKCRGGQS